MSLFSLLHCAKTTAKKPLHHLPRRSFVTKELAENSIIYFAFLRKTKMVYHSNLWRVGAKRSFRKLSQENPAEDTLRIALRHSDRVCCEPSAWFPRLVRPKNWPSSIIIRYIYIYIYIQCKLQNTRVSKP